MAENNCLQLARTCTSNWLFLSSDSKQTKMNVIVSKWFGSGWEK